MAVAYEAGPGGYDLHRLLTAIGVACGVIAPSLIPVRAADRVKTDRRDAKKLVRLYRAGELSFVAPPSPMQEGLRDLVRCRDDLRCARTAARHRVTKALLARGHIYREGKSWTARHRAWIASQHLEDPLAHAALEHMLCHLAALDAEITAVDGQLAQVASREPWADPVAWLCSFRGISTDTALGLLAALLWCSCRRVGDSRRSANRSSARRAPMMGWPPWTGRSTDATGPLDRPLSGGRGDGDLRPGPVPGALGGAAADHPDHRQGPAYESPGDESRLGHGQRRLCRRDGPGCAFGPASSPASDAGPLCRAAGARLGARGGRSRRGRLHRWARVAGPLHQPAADRGRPPTRRRVFHLEAALDGDDPQRLHLRSGRTGTACGRHPGASQRVASIVLDHRRHRRGGAGAVAADLSGRPAG